MPSLPPLTVSSRNIPRLSVTEWLDRRSARERYDAGGSGDAVLVGVLVHRLFQAFSRGLGADADVRAVAASLLRAEERAASPDVESVVEQAAAIWTAVAARDEIVRLLASGEVMAEVPFSLRIDEGGRSIILRGTIDGVAIASRWRP